MQNQLLCSAASRIFTLSLLHDMLNSFRSAFLSFPYWLIDFESERNMGFAFINFKDVETGNPFKR